LKPYASFLSATSVVATRVGRDVRSLVRRILWVSFVSCAVVAQISGWIPTWNASYVPLALGIVTFDLAFLIVMSKRPTLGSAGLMLVILVIGEWWALVTVAYIRTFSRR